MGYAAPHSGGSCVERQWGYAPTLDIWAFPLPVSTGSSQVSFALLSLCSPCSLEESKKSITKGFGGLEVFVCLVGCFFLKQDLSYAPQAVPTVL